MSKIEFVVKLMRNLFLALDQMINTILLGHCDETLSSRLGRSKGKARYRWVNYFRIIVNTLFFFDNTKTSDGGVIKHCEKSIMPLEQQNFREVIDYELWSWNKE
jgi:hypothetical protein|tara:strand:- start:3856 stop:4167 length:312 start_codon:yes stop_codon:yes gene_type:complete